MTRKVWYLVGAGVLLAVLVVAAPFVYARWIAPEAAAPLAVGAGSGAAVEELAGAYTAGPGSEAGYRVGELLFGQRVDAVGRTSDVSGTVEMSGTQVTSGDVTVQMGTVTSDDGRRDEYFLGRLMETETHPTSEFTLTGPLELGPEFADGTPAEVTAAGTLTVKDVTREVEFPLTAVRDGADIQVSGAIPLTFTDVGIEPPAFGDVVTVDDTGEVEFLLALTPTG
ncbi:YceI family protein [Pseudonocardia nematodicida]|uniref:YceI family protein n=1 Tax=Pseudonocardia nematodicida TaxID=1206997 RepID=A0ABV1K3P4_9PSEU